MGTKTMSKLLPHYNQDRIAAFDVDETLVKMGKRGEILVHDAHIKSIRDHWYRGHHVIVWSGGGKAWADYVVDLLGIRHFVHETKAKVLWSYDDRPETIKGESVYLYNKEFNNGRTIGAYEEISGSSEEPVTLPSDPFRPISVVSPTPAIAYIRIKSPEDSGNSGG